MEVTLIILVRAMTQVLLRVMVTFWAVDVAVEAYSRTSCMRRQAEVPTLVDQKHP